MLAKKLVNTVLHSMAESGLKKRTIASNYTRHYHAFCAVVGEAEMDEGLVASFLAGRHGGNILDARNSQLTRYEQEEKRAFFVLLHYAHTGKLPARFVPAVAPQEGDLHILDMYLTECLESGNARRTLQRKRDSIMRFLSVNSLQETTQASIHAYLCSFSGQSTYYLKREMGEIRFFLAYCVKHGFAGIDLAHAIPKIKATKDSIIPSVYAGTEVKELLLHISMKDSKNKLRDYAMVLLMAVYGFRSADVSLLRFDCLDFEKGFMTFSQSKTGTVVHAKMLPHVGNALVDYILSERPESDSNIFFLQANGIGLSPKTVSGVVREGFLASGVVIGARRYGSHSLRHSVATGLINDGYSIFEVANALGQTSAETARLYAKVDLAQLSLCALEVPANE